MESDLLQALNEEYGLEAIGAVEPVLKGVLSQNWFLTVGSTNYFLKRYRFDNEERIQEIHAAKQYFLDRGIPVIAPLPTRSGRTFVSVPSGFYALFPRLYERELSRGAFTENAVVSMGAMLGRIHLAGKDSRLSIKKDMFKSWDTSGFEEKAQAYIQKLSSVPNPTEFDRLALEDMQLKLSLIENDPTTYTSLDLASDHLIHGDYLDHNLFFNEQDEVSHVFDFEKSQYAPRGYELIRSMMYGVFAEDYSERQINLARVYIQSYRSEYPISDDEITRSMELFHLKSLRNIWIQKEYYELNNHRPAQFLEPDTMRITFLSTNRRALLEALIRA